VEVKEEEGNETIEVDSSDAESPDAGQLVPKLAVGKARAAKYGMEFHEGWFEAHEHHCKKDHWKGFLMRLASHETMTEVHNRLECLACRKVISECRSSSVTDEFEDREDEVTRTEKMSAAAKARFEELKQQEGLEGQPRGRRKRRLAGHVPPLHHDLLTWLAARRPGKYYVEDSFELRIRCLLCD
jgi:hypothetical protein